MEKQKSLFVKINNIPVINPFVNTTHGSDHQEINYISNSDAPSRHHKKTKSNSSNSITNFLNYNSSNINLKLISKRSSESQQSKQLNLTKSSKKSSRKLKQENHSTKSLPATFTFGNKSIGTGYNSNIFSFRSIDEDTFNRENLDLDKKLIESLHLYSNYINKNEGSSINTLNKVRGVLINWLKDSEQDNLEYNKFLTEKKIKYILKNKEKCEAKIKNLENELVTINFRKGELEILLQNGYLNYEVEELTQDIERFANSWEIKTGKSKKMIEKFEEMKLKLPLVQEYHLLKEHEVTKSCEKKELQKVLTGSSQTLGHLSNYYKNLRKKINELTEK